MLLNTCSGVKTTATATTTFPSSGLEGRQCDVNQPRAFTNWDTLDRIKG